MTVHVQYSLFQVKAKGYWLLGSTERLKNAEQMSTMVNHSESSGTGDRRVSGFGKRGLSL